MTVLVTLLENAKKTTNIIGKKAMSQDIALFNEMENFKIKIADLNLEINSIFECAKIFCKDYLTKEDKTDFAIHMKEEDIDKEKERDIHVRTYGNEIPKDYPREYIELLAIYRKIASKMLDCNRLLLHGSSISFNNEGVIFMADSGIGKSTHRKNWQDAFLEKVILINDDKPIVHIKEDEVIVYGTPWSGKNGYNTNISVRLNTIYALKRSEKNFIEEINENKKWELLSRQAYFKDEDRLPTLFLLDRLIKLVPIKILHCNKEVASAYVAKEGLNGSF